MQEKSFVNNQLGIKFNSYIDYKCRVWFKAKEVAQILGYKNTEHAIKRHVSENHKRTFLLSCPPETGRQVIKDKKAAILKRGVRSREDGLYLLMKQVFMNLFLNIDYQVQEYFVNGFLLKFYHLYANMVTME